MRLPALGLILLATLLAVLGPALAGAPRFNGGLIPDPVILLPDGPASATVVLISDAPGWSVADTALAEALRGEGAAVAGIDLPGYFRAIAAAPWDCVIPAYDIEHLGQQMTRATGTTAFRAPIVVGIGAGGALAQVVATQTRPATLGGVIAVDPAATLTAPKPFCTPVPPVAAGAGLHYPLPNGPLPAPLTVILTPAMRPELRVDLLSQQRHGAGFAVREVALPAEQARMAALRKVLLPATTEGLPVVELPATPGRDTLAVVISGDGGWRDIDIRVAEVFQKQGVPTLGLDALRYFWGERTPVETARDLGRIIAAGREKWRVRHVLLVGYSFGADVLPDTIAALDPATRDSIVMVSLLALSQDADWQITVAGWLGSASARARPIAPALAALPPPLVQCIFGRADTETACPDLRKTGAEVVETAGGHHFDGDYEALAARILAGLDARLAARPWPASSTGPPTPLKDGR